jgi:putative nucleotidyltransferase with HDIG domain
LAVFPKPTSSRRRTRNFDLDSKTRRARGGLHTVVSKKNISATLVSLLFFSARALVVLLGARGLGRGDGLGLLGLLLAGELLFAWFISIQHRDVLRDWRRLIMFHSVTLIALSVAKIFCVLGWPSYLIPLPLLAVAVSVGLSQQLAVLWTIGCGLMIGLISGLTRGFARGIPVDLGLAAVLIVGALVCVLALSRVNRRRKVVGAGLQAGLALAVMIFVVEGLTRGSTELLSVLRHQPRTIGLLVTFGFLNGLFTGYFLVEFGIRLIEASFDVVTDLKLNELADLNQPILKRFAIDAPGTFHHSQMVGTLAEAGVEAIGGNALLVRVGAHFHDIGKMVKPEYFIENVRGPNKHDRLTPRMSTMVIIGHVKDGEELAERLGLPSQVIDFIPEHHGTIAVEYFYRQAAEQQAEQGGPLVSKDDFRYPGPKPRTRESAVLMIADSVEAISRLLDDPNPSRLEAVVQDVIDRRMREGQFDECPVTLKDLEDAKTAMVRVLLATHHGRIKYPKAPKSDLGVLDTPDINSSLKLRLAEDLAVGPGVPSAAALAPPSSASADDGG